jgi:endonuclease VIII
MPEGDTVLLTARRLDAALSGRPLDRAELRWPRIPPDALRDTTVLRTHAYGKHIFTAVDTGWTLHTHLRMDGVWTVARTGDRRASGRGDAVRAVLANTIWTCVGTRLGMMDVVRTRDEYDLISHLGPDILADDFLTSPTGLPLALSRLAAQGERPICEVLLDQRPMAGVGTLFSAEGLFERQIWPWTQASHVGLEPLVLSIRKNLQRGVAVPVTGRRVHVHARAGEPCHRCGTPIIRGLAGAAPRERPMFYCPRCQREAGP